MSCTNGTLSPHKARNSFNSIHLLLIMIGFLQQKEIVMYLLLDLQMAALEFIINQAKYKKLLQMHILNQ